ncbi:MAG: hypothetical protein ACE5LH_04595 [Fidelibacterota bacterium]
MTASVVVLVRDFELGTRIADAVTGRGKRVVFPEDGAALDRELSQSTELVIIDLEEKEYRAVDLVKDIRKRYPELSIVGFHRRIRKEAYATAREAGCSWVFSRSSLVKNLPTLLGEGWKENAGGRR